jgi:hypothetical protein
MKTLTGAVLMLAASFFYLAACFANSVPGVAARPVAFFSSLVCGLLGLLFLAQRDDQPKK